MTERAEFVRERMRQDWGVRTRHYAAYSVPKNRPFAELLVAAVAPAPGERVLDVATGPGVVAVAAARAVGPTGHVVATDLAPEWGEVVAEACADAGIANVEFRAMGAEALALPDESFDVALCQFGLMFVPDPVRALREMRRVLRPGGRLGVAVWSTADKVLHSLAIRIITAGVPPVPAEERLPSPLDLGEPGLIERHVAAAGFREIVVQRHTRDHVVADPEEEWRHRLEDPASVAAQAARALPADQRRRLHDEVIAALEAYRQGDEIRLPSEAIFVTALR